jgi:hypothetical protein
MLRGTGIALVSGALLLAACGNGDEASPAADQETANEAIAAVEQALRDDGFTASPDNEDDDDDDLSFQSEACREFEAVASPLGDPEFPGETARATSRVFDRGKFELSGGVEEHVGALVAFVEQPQDFDRLFDVLNDDRLVPCFEEAMRIRSEKDADEGQEAVEIRDIEVETLGADGLGDAGGGYQGTAEIVTQGFTVLASFASQYVRVDRAVVAVNVVAIGNEEPTADRTALLQNLVDGVSARST